MVIVVVIIVAVIVAVVAAVYLQDEKINAQIRLVGITGPPSALPLIGNTFEFLAGLGDFARKSHAKYGEFYVTKTFGKPMLHVTGKTLVKQMLVTDQQKLEPGWPPAVGLLLGDNSLSTANSETHPPMRRGVQNSLSPKNLKAFSPEMARIILAGVNSWFKEARQGPFNVAPQTPELALKVMAEMLLGKNFARQHFTRMAALYHDFVLGLFALPVNLPFMRFGKAMKCRAQLDELFAAELAVHELAQADDYASNPDLKDTLVAEFFRRGMSFEEITDSIVTVMFAAHDTTASLMQLSLHYAAAGKGNASFVRIRAELEEHLGITPDTPEKEMAEAITKIRAVPYVVSFVDEALRMQPVVSAMFRKVVSPIAFGDTIIPVGWGVAISLTTTIEDAPTFINDLPRSFDAERFMKTPPQGLEYCPFGAGRRRCPGQEAAKLEASMLLALVALKGDLEPVGEALPDLWDVDPTPKPRPGLVFDFLPLGAQKKRMFVSSKSRRSSVASRRASTNKQSVSRSSARVSARRASSKRVSKS